ncbi:MAG: acyl--CoA ligase [Desulfobulbaceae bacterium]|nr:acyl--CoA ligase [Desulfobulbaceae bacterium]
MKAEKSELDQRCRALLQTSPWPNRPFIIDGLSHAELHLLAARLYWQLKDIAPAQPICLASEDKGLCAAALLAALAGGPPILLPYALSPQALAALNTATGYSHALVSDAPDNMLELPPGVQPVRVPMHPKDVPAASRPLPSTPATGTVLHLFTGGSTGAPQLWSKTAANLFGEALFIAAHHGIGSEDRIVATIQPYHIYGLLYSVLLPLVSGASVLAPTPAFPEEMVEAIRTNDISIFISVPAHYRALANKSCASSALRLAFSSAGMLAAADSLDFSQANQVGIDEIYGSTETGGIACRNRFRGEDHFIVLPPISWRLGPEERLCVRSPFLSPELPLDADNFFHTADRILPQDANGFTLLGRTDLVVKVGGKRVDLEPIRLLLQEQTGVREAVVLALPEGGSRENRIAAILTEIRPDAVDMEALRHELGRRLEPYAMPRILKLVPQIPVKTNGKYDREAILALVSA